LKPSLQKLRIIVRSNIDSFLNSALIAVGCYALVYFLIHFVFDKAGLTQHIIAYRLHKPILIIGVSLAFGIPLVVYFWIRFSQATSGVSAKPTDDIKAKRSLFVQFGILWTSLGVAVLCLVQKIDYLTLIASIVAAFNWVSIHRTIGAYVLL
jgi:hypothetical protein